MTALERHCRWLLHVYPAWYRRQRGREILATLLEASPPGRSWPSPRDARALLMAGLQVRAWRNQRLTTAASVRQAVLLGAALVLASVAAAWFAPRPAAAALALAAAAAMWEYWGDRITVIQPAGLLILLAILAPPWIILGAVMLWAAVDARPAVAMAIWLTSTWLVFNLLSSIDDLLRSFGGGPQGLVLSQPSYLSAAGSAVLAAAAIGRLRHQAVL
jgi:hypothetical protein